MKDIDLLITDTGEFGTFSWEMPEKMKERFRHFYESLPAEIREQAIQAIKEDMGRKIESLLHCLLGAMFSPAILPLMELINAKLVEIARLSLEMNKEHRPLS